MLSRCHLAQKLNIGLGFAAKKKKTRRDRHLIRTASGTASMPGATSTEPGGATSPSPVLMVACRQFGPQIWALCHLMAPRAPGAVPSACSSGRRGGRYGSRSSVWGLARACARWLHAHVAWFLVAEMAPPSFPSRTRFAAGRAGGRVLFLPDGVRASSLVPPSTRLRVIRFHPRNHVWANASTRLGPAAFGVPCLCRYIAEATSWRLGSVREALPVMTSATQYDLVSAIF